MPSQINICYLGSEESCALCSFDLVGGGVLLGSRAFPISGWLPPDWSLGAWLGESESSKLPTSSDILTPTLGPASFSAKLCVLALPLWTYLVLWCPAFRCGLTACKAYIFPPPCTPFAAHLLLPRSAGAPWSSEVRDRWRSLPLYTRVLLRCAPCAKV